MWKIFAINLVLLQKNVSFSSDSWSYILNDCMSFFATGFACFFLSEVTCMHAGDIGSPGRHVEVPTDSPASPNASRAHPRTPSATPKWLVAEEGSILGVSVFQLALSPREGFLEGRSGLNMGGVQQ